MFEQSLYSPFQTAGLGFKKLHFQDLLLLICLTWNLYFWSEIKLFNYLIKAFQRQAQLV